MESVALYSFQATEKDELPFRKGDTLKVQGTVVAGLSCGSSLQCHHHPHRGRRGSVRPMGSPRPCQHPQALPTPGDAARMSPESHPPSFCSYGKHVQHFKVLRERNGKYFLWEEKFNSLNELVDFYRMTTITKEQQIFLWDEDQTQQVP
ncbi:GRAP protein, partial [Chloropsis hardwickii]|nr:GRAP protein [Chloropsis hardwickii]